MNKDELHQLTRFWYKKAAESGFEDAEELINNELTLKQYHSLWRTDPTTEEYYTLVLHYVEDPETEYLNNSDRVIMMKHAEGWKITSIVTYLRRMRLYRCRYSVRIIIRRYLQKWNIRHFTPRQLHIETSYRKPHIPSLK